MKPKLLFICNWRTDSYGSTVGLFNQAKLTASVLQHCGLADAEAIRVPDSNFIDREVHNRRPDVVIIEALWVPPYKFEQLFPLHPNVRWVVRVHSNTPFLAIEGIAFPWLYGYTDAVQGLVDITGNNARLVSDLQDTIPARVSLLPNLYPFLHSEHRAPRVYRPHLDVGCFGAIRPLKNQLLQGVAAIEFGTRLNVPIHFHINAGRVEQGGQSVLKNLRAVFENCPPHQLVEHPWYEYADFRDVVKTMDLGMQVSLTETFNVVTADFVSLGVPVVTSTEVEWMPWLCKALDATDTSTIVRALMQVYGLRNLGLTWLSASCLRRYNKRSLALWKHYLKRLSHTFREP